MQKAHDAAKNNYWRNYPNISTPIVQDELNRNESTVDVIDDRVITLDTTKANQTDLLQSLKTVSYTQGTGTFTFTFWNGSTIVIDTDLEKIPVNFDYDDDPTSAHYQNLILYLVDGTIKYVDLSSMITQFEFINSPTIRFTVNNNGEVQANVIDGSITGAKLQPNYLADITTQANAAAASATASSNSATLSQSWAQGGTGTREGEDTMNSKYYSDLAEETVAELLAAFGVSVVGTRLVFGTTFEEQYGIEVVGTKLVISEIV